MGPAFAAVAVALEGLQQTQPDLAAAIQGPGPTSSEKDELEESLNEDFDPAESRVSQFCPIWVFLV